MSLRIQLLSITLITALLLGLTPRFAMAQEVPQGFTAVTSTELRYGNVTTPPEKFQVPIIADVIPSEGLRSVRLVTTVPAGLSLDGIGVTTVGGTMEGGSIGTDVSTDGNGNIVFVTTVAVQASLPVPQSQAGQPLFFLKLEKLSISNDIEYTLTGTARANETNLPASAVVSGVSRIEMIDTTGRILSWDGKEVAGADISLVSSTETKTTSTNSTGHYHIRTGFVGNHVLSFVWPETIPTEPYITEDDVSFILEEAAAGGNVCPTIVGDYTGNGEVTEDDASFVMDIAADPSTYSTQVFFSPNNIALNNYRLDSVRDTTAYLRLDCTGNYSWLTGVGGGSILFAEPTITSFGSTLRLEFLQTRSTKFFIEGLGNDARLNVHVHPVIARSGEVPTLVRTTTDHAVIISTQGRDLKTIKVDITISARHQSPVTVTVRGRTQESEYFDWGSITVTPDTLADIQIYLPAVVR